jgi:hypothetical protein
MSRSQPNSGSPTPLPWTSKLYDFSCVIQGPGKIQVASTSWHGSIRASYPLKPESLANIEFIVEAVNSHASLKARIQELEGVLKLAEYVSRKDSLSEHERLASARTVICRALQPKDGAK